MTGGQNHETESADKVIGPRLENKKGGGELGHLIFKYIGHFPRRSCHSTRGEALRAVRDGGYGILKVKACLWGTDYILFMPVNEQVEHIFIFKCQHLSSFHLALKAVVTFTAPGLPKEAEDNHFNLKEVTTAFPKKLFSKSNTILAHLRD